MGVKISKRYSYSYDSFSAKLFLNVPCGNPHRSYLLGFCYIIFFKKMIEI